MAVLRQSDRAICPTTSLLLNRHFCPVCSFASSHGLLFNTEKTQLILFRRNANNLLNDIIQFDGVTLQYSEYVQHLGHLLAFNLDDEEDISRATKKIIRSANMILCTFGFADLFVLTRLTLFPILRTIFHLSLFVIIIYFLFLHLFLVCFNNNNNSNNNNISGGCGIRWLWYQATHRSGLRK